MSSRRPRGNKFDPPGIIDAIFSKVQNVNNDLVDRLLRRPEGDLDQIQSQLDRANRMTCRAFWRGWAECGDGHAWPLVDKSWKILDPLTRWHLLDRALHDGLANQAIRMINNGVPMNSLAERGLHIQGPAAKLMANEYENIDREASISIASAMFRKGAVSMINPSSIVFFENVGLFLDHAPAIDNKQAWLQTMTWQPDDVLGKDGGVFVFEPEAKSVLMFLEAGYPCDHVDLLARACMEGRSDVAELILDWGCFDVGDADRIPESWESGIETVAPKSFWHALVDHWGKRKSQALRQNVFESDCWPSFDVCKKILAAGWASPDHLDSRGRTALERAQHDFGHLGLNPMEATLAMWKRDKLLDISNKTDGGQDKASKIFM